MNMDAGFSSPPKLRRSVSLSRKLGEIESPLIPTPVICGHTPLVDLPMPTPPDSSGLSELSSSSICLEGALVEQAVDNLLSLPEVVGQVSAIQKDHNKELERQLMQLKNLQNDIKESNAKHRSVKQEISSIDRKTRMIEEEVMENEKLCQAHQKQIDSLVKVCESLRHQLTTKQKGLLTETSKHAYYMSKMKTYKTQVNDFEISHPAQKKLAELQQRLEDLKKQKQLLSENMDEFLSVSTGQREADIKEIDKVKLETCTWKEEMLHKQKMLEDLKHQEEKIQIATSVLHKRNAAQLTRLKRQVREQQLRQRQWHNQHSQLQHSIAEISKRLAE
ncbi:dynactin subunit 1-like isoform X1 [Haliotis rufescens]|uniref:dynactin subunit 1-like isoform X1 n=1 Tax=Haliotis rufescens TaxID=6454 RepID=UPI00201F63CF|nr:dynactin subunit 1-like isoform X1 [Haliotis rufescens]